MEPTRTLFFQKSVYTDIYLGDDTGDNLTIPLLRCVHAGSDLRPYVRRSFYNGTLELNFPNKPEAIVAQLYGPNWRVPDAKKKKHGGAKGIMCSKAKTKAG